MNEEKLRRRLEWYGCDDKEIEDAVDAWAEEQADARRDEEVTEYFQQQGE